MDTRELQKLAEAYSQVHAPQEVDEAVKGASPHAMQMRKDAAAERRAGIKPLPAKKGEEYAKYKMAQMAYSKRKREMDEDVEQVDEATYSAKAARAGKDIGKPGKAFAKIAASAGKRYGSKERGEKVAGAVLAKLRKQHEEVDIFDVVLEFLQTEGYENPKQLMAELSSDHIDAILEAQVANRDPDKYEREQEKKYAPVRGEKTPMPPRGDKRREDFEKWYAKQMGR